MQGVGSVRIIGGSWRGKRIPVPAVEGLRPTPDRVRETLFNWLLPHIHSAHCLDLFAGCGALGLEAASRGAASVDFVDQNPVVINHLRKVIGGLKGAPPMTSRVATLPEGLGVASQLYDIVFLDPPYQAALCLPMCDYLWRNNFLARGCLLYLESDTPIDETALSSAFRLRKVQRAGKVWYHLAEFIG